MITVDTMAKCRTIRRGSISDSLFRPSITTAVHIALRMPSARVRDAWSK